MKKIVCVIVACAMLIALAAREVDVAEHFLGAVKREVDVLELDFSLYFGKSFMRRNRDLGLCIEYVEHPFD